MPRSLLIYVLADGFLSQAARTLKSVSVIEVFQQVAVAVLAGLESVLHAAPSPF